MSDYDKWLHDHSFHLDSHTAERKTQLVIGLTVITMLVEIVAGTVFNSMALLADGWHMSTHAAALSITAFAYFYARKYARDPRYTFGTGKVGVLGGFASAVALLVVALVMAVESVERLIVPQDIRFNQAIVVAVVGLVVNLFSAFLLRDHPHEHGSGEHISNEGSHDVHHGHFHHEDYNLRAAYLHVLADALTSILAIVALTAGKLVGWAWLDPTMGLVGAMVICHWAYLLIRDTSKVLLDSSAPYAVKHAIQQALEGQDGHKVTDLHLWHLGPTHLAAIVSLVATNPKAPEYYKSQLAHISLLSHVTIEVNEYR